MDFEVTAGKPETLTTPCLIAGLFADGKLPASTNALDKASGGRISELVKSGDHKGDAGQSLMLHALDGIAGERVLLIGLGKEADFDRHALAKSMQTVRTVLKGTRIKQATVLYSDVDCESFTPAQRIRIMVESGIDAGYRFDKNLV